MQVIILKENNSHQKRTGDSYMDISVLAEFVSLVETLSFQETAARMNISQSALTKHIHKLEEELDVTLFDRSQRSVKVNDYSNRFYPFARQIVQLYQDSVVSLKELNDADKTSFTVAYNPVVAQYGLVDTIADFAARHPEHNMLTTETYKCAELLKNQKCDFAFVGETESEGSSFSKMIYKSDRLAVVVRDDHPLADRQTVSLEQLEDEKFIVHSSSTGIPHDETRKFMDLCDAHQFKPDIVAESNFTSTMIRYVSMGRGVAVLNRKHIPWDVDNVKVIDFYPAVESCIYLMYPRRITSSCASDFLHYMIDLCNG